MLRLDDFVHLPELDAAVTQLVAGQPGLIVVAGLDARPTATPAVQNQFLPSGRIGIFRALIGELIAANPRARAIVIATDPAVFRVPRELRRRFTMLRVEPPLTEADRIREAVARGPELLIVDRLHGANAAAVLEAAHGGTRVIVQLDSVFRAAAVARHIRDLGVPEAHLSALRWVVFVQRLATLCPHCRRPALLSADPAGYEAPGCEKCQGSGRLGDVATFDVFAHSGDTRADPAHPGPLPLEDYTMRLAEQGFLSLDDVRCLDIDLLRRTYVLLTSSEHELAEANTTLQRKLAELRSANSALRQRTEALLALQDTGRALMASSDLGDLALRICRHAGELCGADRAILYGFGASAGAEVLAVNGWSPALVRQRIGADLLARAAGGVDAEPFDDWPPGIPPRHADVEGAELRAGLRVPLAAEGRPVGLMIVHSTLKGKFAPGETALLQAFAHQAAVAIQRAALVDQLRDKIRQLEQAQAALVQKERLDREMELAREVQQSVLPQVFPHVAGLVFAARNQPARQVGGDFYDVFMREGGQVGLVIADVSGKGMPAALYMALTRSLLLAEAQREQSPRVTLLNVNRLLRQLGEPHMFVTVWYGIIDPGARRLTYARAGHDYPLLFRHGTAITLAGAGTVLGAFDSLEVQLSEERLDLAPGDRLVLYTDGLTDVFNEADEWLGLAQFTALLSTCAAEMPESICSATFDALARYQGAVEQFDDMTMLVVGVE